ncbi:MAG: phage late control D family protein [Clostridiaceae bacterium]
MELIYNDVNITNKVKINSAIIVDNCGGKVDSIQCIFSDIEKNWRNWNPQKDDRLILSTDKFSSGVMFIDELHISRGLYRIDAISIPLTAKTKQIRSWESIRFKNLAEDLASEIGLSVETYYITDWMYERIDQINETNMEFLSRICILEGYTLKITNNKAVIYDEITIENSNSILEVSEIDIIGDYSFSSTSSGLYSGCELDYFSFKNELIKYNFTPSVSLSGPLLKVNNIKVSNYAEAERFTRNLLRYHNKYEVNGGFSIGLNSNIGAANTLNIEDLGSFNGKYFIEKVVHNLTNNKSRLEVRKTLEGY